MSTSNLRSRQMNPCDHLYWKCRGFEARPHDWRERVAQMQEDEDEDYDDSDDSDYDYEEDSDEDYEEESEDDDYEEDSDDSDEDYDDYVDVKSLQSNPNNDAYWQARGFPRRPNDWQQRIYGNRGSQSNTGNSTPSYSATSSTSNTSTARSSGLPVVQKQSSVPTQQPPVIPAKKPRTNTRWASCA